MSIGSLSLGLAVALLTGLWCINEFSFDTFHHQPENTYRIIRKGFINNESISIGAVGGRMGLEIIDKTTSIGEITRIYSTSDILTVGQHCEQVNNVYAADSNYYRILNFPLKTGDFASFAQKPNAIIISEAWALKYFPNISPIGEILSYKGEREVVGVMKNMPVNSSLNIEAIVRIDGIDYLRDNQWGGNDKFITFLTLQKGANTAELEKLMTKHACEMFEPYKAFELTFHLQPILDMHLGDRFRFDFVLSRSKNQVLSFGLMAILVLIIACINFVNLFISSSILSAKAVGIKKTHGASKFSLMMEFFVETLIYTSIASIIAILAVELILPGFSSIIGYKLSLPLSSIDFYISIIGLILVVTLIAGSFPAIYMTHFNPLLTLKDQFKGNKVSFIQKSLVIFQVGASIVLLISSISIKKQISFLQNMDLGFNKENVLYVHMDRSMGTNFQRVSDELLSHPDIISVSGKNSTPLEWQSGTTVRLMNAPETKCLMEVCDVKPNYIDMMEMPLIAGNNPFEIINDSLNYCLINEEAAKVLGKQNLLEQRLDIKFHGTYIVKGIVRNAYTKSLHQNVDPQVYKLMTEDQYGVMLVKVSGNPRNAIQQIGQIWRREIPDKPFEYHFLDDDYNRLYRDEEVAGQIATWLMLISFFITIAGLFGLASYVISRRTKEVGLRKVNGATVLAIVTNLNSRFIKWVVIAFVIACPIAWYAMDKWLENFAYKTNLSWGLFALAGVLALIIALITVSVQSWKAASRNPIESLRYE
ncbi:MULTISPECIES: ABC transporter permease [unclassified Carboxylicivirga]|uniref:ABC transporter permease n=1 Tax=Carboxylicivirga TaxID=1628153 RepID=UPI003D333BDD